MSSFEYFQSYKNYFWQWEDQAEVISIPGSHTIAYRAFLAEVLQKLSHQGLPPLGSLLMAMVATNPEGLDKVLEPKTWGVESLDASTSADISMALVFLKVLSQVPKEYKQGAKRVLLFQAIFENCHHIVSVKKSKQISDDLSSARVFGTFLGNENQQTIKRVTIKADFNPGVFRKELRTIGILSNKFKTVEDILDKIAGLKEIPPEELLLEEPLGEGEETDFTEQLIKDTRTFHVGSLIKRIWSGLNIPAHSYLPSLQSIGGVSDLTNKGSFDKLLISEFANDDLIFLSRVANNESLYIRRETPPESNESERIILMDVSLKNWGTPKTLAFSLALAIAQHPKAKMPCSLYVIGDTYQPVLLDTVHHVIEAMQNVDPALHAGNGLTAFFKDFPLNKGREVFLITSSSSLKQSAMLKAMNECHDKILYWLYTDAEGRIDFYKKQQNSKKHLQHLELPLKELWKPVKKKTINSKKSSSSDFPILVKNSVAEVKTFCSSDGEIFQVTKDKVLLRCYDKHAKAGAIGWQVVYENLPFVTSDLEIGLLSNGEYLFLMYNHSSRNFILLNLQTKELKTVKYPHWGGYKESVFTFYEDVFYQTNRIDMYAIDADGTISEFDKSKKITPPDKSAVQNKIYQLSRYTRGILKNVSHVFINDMGNLVFNKHELLLNNGYHIKLDSTAFLTRQVSAKRNTDKEFVFPDGSTVEINRNGMFILKSSDDNIGVIYVPAFLDGSLGIATATHFAGNEYYYRSLLYQINLTSSGKNRLAVTKIIKEVSGFGLAQAKELTDAESGVLVTAVTLLKAEEIKKLLQEAGAQVEMIPVKTWGGFSEEVTRIDTSGFFRKYITPFINTIQKYGTAN